MRLIYTKVITSMLTAFTLSILMCGCHGTTKNFGGTMTIELEPGRKLEEITWKDDSDLWILSRPFREGEEPETHTFQADTEWGVFEGTVVIVESK